MIKFLIIIFLFLSNCSFNENSKIWKEEIKLSEKENVKEILIEDNKELFELNSNLSIDFGKVSLTQNKGNNTGSQPYNGNLNKVGAYKFSKLKSQDISEQSPIFKNEHLYFFDKKGNVIKYDNSQKIIWKNNIYTKKEKKLSPNLTLSLTDKGVLVTDDLANYYFLDQDNGELIWKNKSIYPFNSETKIIENKFFAIDYKNIIRCFSLIDGEECWNFETENSFTLSSSKPSIVLKKPLVIFSNTIGDITALNIENGQAIWQLPTQSSEVLGKSYNFKNSTIVLDNDNIFFSNNNSEFYSVNSKNGITNWVADINSNVKPIIINDFIITVTNDGYLVVMNKKDGNIIRTNYLLSMFKEKKRKKINVSGFTVGNLKAYITFNNGFLMVVDLKNGNTSNLIKIARSSLSKPIIYQDNLYILKNGAVNKFD